MTSRTSAVLIASQALCDDPSFPLATPAEQRAQAAEELRNAGISDPTDLEISDAITVREQTGHSQHTVPRQRKHIPAGRLVDPDTETPVLASTIAAVDAGVLSRFVDATGASDTTLAGVLDLPRSTVQAMRGGRMPEKLDRGQLETLIFNIRAQQGKLAALEVDLTLLLLI